LARAAISGRRCSTAASVCSGPTAISVTGCGERVTTSMIAPTPSSWILPGYWRQPVVRDPALLSTGTTVPSCAEPDRNVRPSGNRQDPGNDLGTVFGLAAGGRDQAQVKLRTFQEHRQGPGIVDVVADVGVEDHRDLLGGGHRPLGAKQHQSCAQGGDKPGGRFHRATFLRRGGGF